MIGLYVHLPFCRAHCTYCAFAISTDISLQERYIEALLRELSARSSANVVDSIYFGGGTPSRTAPEHLERVVAQIRKRFPVSDDVEFSLEANPEDVTADTLARWRSLGVNRVSIGVQSFHDSELVPLGRVHGAQLAREAVALAVASGVNANLDLILGLPGQTAQSFAETLRTAVSLGAGHLSLYMLDVEEKSPLQIQIARGRVVLPQEDLIAESYIAAVETLEREGLRQYEISNFARPGHQCRHNLRYWSRGEYLGFGMGAHSLQGAERSANTRGIGRYIERSPEATEFSETLGEQEIRREMLFLRLRQTSGIDYVDLKRLCGLEGTEWVDRGLRDGWLRREQERVAFTPSGFLLSNEYIAQLF